MTKSLASIIFHPAHEFNILKFEQVVIVMSNVFHGIF